VAADETEQYPSRDDRIVVEFGDGFDVEGIALRYGLTVAQVYAVVEREVGPADQAHPGPPQSHQGFQPAQGFPDGDAIVAEYGEGNDIEWIARKYGITVERVYEVVERTVENDPRPPTGAQR
jgi:Mor family transcriptional regulator